jgi:hypothetical protein
MLRITCLLFLLLTNFAQAQEFPKEIEEPTIDKLTEWIPEQIPRTVSFYFDTDGDGLYDIIIAYFLIEAYACKEKCNIEITENDDHWILVSSIGSNPYSYYIIKEWSMWRLSDKDDWKGVEKSSESIYKYKNYNDWYNDKFLKLWPETAP